jgi:MtaA/CmuA family methyltransferase
MEFVRKLMRQREFMIAVIVFGMFLVMSFASPCFLSSGNLLALLLSLSFEALIAVAMTNLMVSGGFDMSVGSLVAFTGAATALLMKNGLPVFPAVLAGIAIGAAAGFFNGFIVAKVGINPFVTTLASLSLFRGLTMIIARGQNISPLPAVYNAIGQTKILWVQSPIWITVFFIILGDILLRKSRFFRQNYFIGGNEKAARLSGIPVTKMKILNYMFTGLFAGNLICAEKYGVDTVSAISDPMREASAFGEGLVFLPDSVPCAKAPLIADSFDLGALKHFDPLESERTLDRVKACELLHQKAGNDYPLVGWIEGCIAEAADLRGLNELLIDLALGEAYLEELFEIIFAEQKLFAKAQIDAGADIIGVGNAAASLIGPGIYQKYGLEWDRKIVEYIHNCGAKVKLHICGNITALLGILRDVKADILDIDSMVDFAHAAKVFEGSGTAVSGNLHPVAVMMQGSPAYIEAEIRRCMNTGSSTSMVAAGCEAPAATPDETLFLMDRLLYL